MIPYYSKHIIRHSDHVFNIYMTGDMLRLCLTAAILEFGLWLGVDICLFAWYHLISLAHVENVLNRPNAQFHNIFFNLKNEIKTNANVRYAQFWRPF